MQHFKASARLQLAYTVDDFTDPWTPAPTLLLLHPAMGHSGRYYAGAAFLALLSVVRMTCAATARRSAVGRAGAHDGAARQDTAECHTLGCKSAHIVGNSAGGCVAQNLAMTSPGRAEPMLFGPTPGPARFVAATWLLRVAKEGLRNFSRRYDLRSLPVDRSDPRHRMVPRRGGQERHTSSPASSA